MLWGDYFKRRLILAGRSQIPGVGCKAFHTDGKLYIGANGTGRVVGAQGFMIASAGILRVKHPNGEDVTYASGAWATNVIHWVAVSEVVWATTTVSAGNVFGIMCD